MGWTYNTFVTLLNRKITMSTNASEVPHRSSSAESIHERLSKLPIDRRYIWLTTPLLVALVGLLATGFGALVTWFQTVSLERHKFEYSLIQRALSAPGRPEATKYLAFLNDVGLLPSLNKDNIAKALKNNGESLPIFLGAALRDHLIDVQQAKKVLSFLKEKGTKEPFYTGPFDCDASLPYRIAVMKFQRANNLEIDGYIGPKTVLSMWEACPECPDLLQLLHEVGERGGAPPASNNSCK